MDRNGPTSAQRIDLQQPQPSIRQYLQAGLVDELHVAISPVLLGRGESLFADLDLLKLGYQCAEPSI